MHSGSGGNSHLSLGDNVFGNYKVNDLTHKQIGQHLGIPATSYAKLRSDFPQFTDSLQPQVWVSPTERWMSYLLHT